MLTNRSQEKELLDLGPAFYTTEEYQHCQKMLFRVNKLFGFYRSTRQRLKKFSPTATLLDVGCGAGLFLLHLSKNFPQMQCEGVDISSEAIGLAQETLMTWKKQMPTDNVRFQLQKEPALNRPENSVDIILATLVCHHLSDEALITFFQDTYQAARQAVIINDLHRHRFAEWLYSWISPVLFQNRLITYDGLISIRRSFTKPELQSLLQQAGIVHYEIKWHFPFRWSIVLWKK